VAEVLTEKEIQKKERRFQAHLSHLKRDIQEETYKRKKKKRKFKPNQKIMIDFINSVTTSAKFEINGIKIALRVGTVFSGFTHFLEKHYCKNCPGELTMHDILNMDLVISKGLKLNTVGVSNPDNIVYNYKNRDKEHNIVLKPSRYDEDEYVVSFYSVD